MVTGLPALPRIQPTCEACVLGQQHHTPIPTGRYTPTSRILELIHSDLCGPLPHKSLSGSHYILTIIDDFSRRSWVYFLATKDETFATFKAFRRMVESETNHKLSCLHTDRGSEFLSIDFNFYYKTTGVRH
jgi:transposase InsO family protein